jgi:thiol-disulfide isomerase/thioredoxin
VRYYQASDVAAIIETVGDAEMSAPVHAPEILRPGIQWFNVPRPLSLQKLRGKFVILEFWSYCRVSCMHVLPMLRLLQETYPEELVVIGVQSPKFTAERDAASVERAVARLGITYPVAHDRDLQIWKSYGVQTWPTLVFIGPEGRIITQDAGEPDGDALMSVMGERIARSKFGHRLKPRPLELTSVRASDGALAFPGKIKPLGNDARWAVTDGGHHQVVLIDAARNEAVRIGKGEAGFANGDLRTATFNRPQGLVAGTDVIYVADTGNHAIRKIDLIAGKVTTLAGTGRRGPLLPNVPAAAQTVSLASPWDLELGNGRLYFANAGTHQLGEIVLANGALRALAGNGEEGLTDGPAASARLAQPSGLALNPDGDMLCFVDSESSSVRALHLHEAPRVETLAGTGLFDFGHVNGGATAARLQHPLGLCWLEGKLLIADSFNSAIRVVDLERRQVSDFDSGEYVNADPLSLPPGEPAGIATDGTQVFLADTNNHRIVAYDVAAKRYRTWFG